MKGICNTAWEVKPAGSSERSKPQIKIEDGRSSAHVSEGNSITATEEQRMVQSEAQSKHCRNAGLLFLLCLAHISWLPSCCQWEHSAQCFGKSQLYFHYILSLTSVSHQSQCVSTSHRQQLEDWVLTCGFAERIASGLGRQRTCLLNLHEIQKRLTCVIRKHSYTAVSSCLKVGSSGWI